MSVNVGDGRCCSINGYDTCTELLIEAKGVRIIALTDSKGRTPVHAAVFSDQCEALQLLLSHGATVNSVDNQQQPPLMYAAKHGQCLSIGSA